MDILFGISNDVDAIVTGERDGAYLSKYIQPEMREGLFIKENHERHQGKDELFVQSFVRSNPSDKVQSLHVISGVKASLKPYEAQELGARIFKIVSCAKEKNICVDLSAGISPALVAHVIAGFQIRSYSFDKYKTQNREKIFKVEKVYFVSSDTQATEEAFALLDPVVDAVAFVRTLSNEVPNVLYPESFARIARDVEEIKVETLDERDMARLGMNALLSVGQGSEKESRLVVCQWNGGPKGQAPIALVGKGVTFDSGGISLKPSKDMHEMKEDMTGAAIVLTTVQMAARLKLPINIV